MGEKHFHADTRFMKCLGWFFSGLGEFLVNHAWKMIIISHLLCLIGTIKIPLTPITNDIADFTPLDAPSYTEWRKSQTFYGDGIVGNTIFAFVSAKDGGSMYTEPKMKEAIRALDTISTKFNLETPSGKQPFDQFCRAFCVINEPIRIFYNGMSMKESNGNFSSDVDLGYPDSHVMGMRSHMDPYLFGVKVAVKQNGKEVIVPSYEAPNFNVQKQLKDNIRSFKLVVLNFKSELDPAISKEAIEKFEGSIVKYFKSPNGFNSSQVDVVIFAESFITSEVVRAGLSLLPFLVIGFIIMVTFSAVTFCISAIALNQMGWSKIWLSFYTCASPFMACGIGLGGMLFAGIRFGTILCVTPFLILAIGVDHAFLMVNAWQQITSSRRREDLRHTNPESELRHRTREMVIEVGPSIAITTITTTVSFLISGFSGAPEIQLFSVGNAVCVLFQTIYQMTCFGALMVIFGRWEIQQEFRTIHELPKINEVSAEKQPNPLDLSARVDVVRFENRKKKGALVTAAHKILRTYIKALANPWAVGAVLTVLLLYLTASIVATLGIRSSLRPEKLFLPDSPFTKLFRERQEYILPTYGALWIYVFNPGNVWDPTRRAQINSMIHEFETLPHAVGQWSTKFWMRDFEEFAKGNPDLLTSDDYDDDGNAVSKPATKYQQLQSFLGWAENSYWRGFIEFEPEENAVNGSDPAITRFAFTTAYMGADLKDWMRRVTLLKQWRDVATTYADMNITVYMEDNKFLDIIDTMVPQTWQNAVMTIVSMFIVCCMFTPTPLVLTTATFTIISTSIGTFGFMAWIGTELDPILMCATIMVIGFSVDIPAHIAYHFHQTASHGGDVVYRLEHTISRVGFPIVQASFSTMICVVSLFAVNLHMSNIFAATMLTVVVLSMLHGIFVMPAIFAAASIFSDWTKCNIFTRSDSIDITPSSPSVKHAKPNQIVPSTSSGSTTIMVQ